MQHLNASQEGGQPRDAATSGVVLAARSKVSATDVLIVDDDAQLREFLLTSLTLEGYRVAAVANGAEALAYLQRMGPVGMILVDLSMPVMNGWTLCRELRANRRLAAIPVIVTSASLADSRARPAGVTAAFEKPIDVRDLVQAIRTQCPGRTSRAIRSSTSRRS